MYTAYRMKYCNSVDARNILIDDYNWQFSGDEYDCTTGVNDNQDSSISISVYPVPSKEKLTVDFSDYVKDIKVRMVDINGTTQYHKMVTGTRFVIPKLTTGTYFLVIHYENEMIIQKAIFID